MRSEMLLVWVWILIGSVGAAAAATFAVDRFDDEATAQTCAPGSPNDCSLRGAIVTANNTPGGDVVAVPEGTYLLTIPPSGDTVGLSGSLKVLGSDALTIEAPAGQVARVEQTVDGMRVLDAGNSGDLTLRRLILSGGNPAVEQNGGVGGALRSVFGALLAEDVGFVDNQAAGEGGCVYRGGLGAATTLTRVTFEGCVSGDRGGGLYLGGYSSGPSNDLVSGSTFRKNQAENAGGALVVFHSILAVEDSIFEGNLAKGAEPGSGGGGAIAAYSTDLTIQRSSVVRNRAGTPTADAGRGGGLYLRLTSTTVPSVRLENVTLSGNRTEGSVVSGAGVWSRSVDLELAFATVADNPTDGEEALAVFGSSTYPGALDLEWSVVDDGCDIGPDVTLGSSGSNVERPWDGGTVSTCGLSDPSDKVISAGLGLRPPAVYGGAYGVLTQALLPGSPALDRLGAGCIAEDARGAVREPILYPCDSGSHEEQAVPPGPWIFADGFESGDAEAWSATSS